VNLVTGATGIVGSHVVLALLQKGRSVVACRQASSDVSKLEKLLARHSNAPGELLARIRWITLDLNDSFAIEDALEGIDTVYHCAGYVSFNRHHQKQLMRVNHEATRLLVNACLHKKTQSLCHVSSLSTINNLDYTLPLNETVFWKTSGRESAYAISKYNAEREVWRGIEEGLNAVIVNPGVILGEGFWDQSSSRLFDTCYKGSLFYTTGTTGYVAATDVAETMLRLVDGRFFGERYILIEGNYKFKDILSQIHVHFGKKPPFINATRTILNLGWVADSLLSFVLGRKPILTRAIINSSLNRQLYANNKICTALNYKFTPIPQVLQTICQSYLRDRTTS